MAPRKKVTVKSIDASNLIPEDFQAMDPKEAAIQKTIMNKLSAGIVFLSSFYVRFISAVFPMFETLHDTWDNVESRKEMIDRFNFLYRTYTLSNIKVDDEDSKSFELLNATYNFSVMINGMENDVILSLKPIDYEFDNFMSVIKCMMTRPDILDKDTFNLIKNYLIDINGAYIGFLNDILYIFETEELEKSIRELINNIESERTKIKITSLKDISKYSLSVCKTLEEIYRLLIIIEYAIGSTISISDPMHISAEVKQMYDLAFDRKKAEELKDLLIPDERQKYKS